MLKRVLGATIAVTATAAVAGGPLMNALAESSLTMPAHSWSTIAECRRTKQAQPFRDELLLELSSLFARYGIDASRIKVSLIAGGDESQAASAGSQLLPFANAYLLLAEGISLNFALSRVVAPDACDIRPRIHPDETSTILTRPQRYELAHELGHIACEHHTQRIAATATAVGAVLLAGPALRWAVSGSRAAGRGGGRLARAAAAVGSFAAIVPATLLLRWLHRRQEWEADAMAAELGYARGGAEFWSKQAAMRMPSPLVPHLLRTHPYPHERLAFFAAFLNDHNQHHHQQRGQPAH